MKIHKGNTFARLKNPVISIGIFDGVHRGHAAVFERLRQRAEKMDGESAVVTFWPHPRQVIGDNGDNLRFLTTLEEKKALIRRHGIDHLLIIPFTREFSLLPASDFIRRFLVDMVGLRHLVFGFDHHFGRGREGNFGNMKDCARRYGFTIEQLDPVMEGDTIISASAIREALLRGDVSLASVLLSYPYSLRGKITRGEQVGRVIGYPTANIKVDHRHKLVPADGVYAVEVLLGKKLLMGMMNIGVRPTVRTGKGDKTLEVHIINLEADLYRRNIRIRFIERIREERKFGTIELLREQLEKDKNAAIRILSGQQEK